MQKTTSSMARHQGERSPVSTRAQRLQSFLTCGMLRAATISQHGHLDTRSEEAALDGSEVREEQREMNTGDGDS